MASKSKARAASLYHHFTNWYNKWAAFNVESLFSRKRPLAPPRSVLVHQDLPADWYDKKQRVLKDHVYATNQVITSKYTVVTFVPRNLLEQFRRVANCFFLAIAILQFFSLFSTVSPGLVILPLLIVLAITALKDGYEDIKRHQSDRHVNYSQVRVLGGGDYVNTNPMESKSKTFVRGFVPQWRRRPKKSKVPTNETQHDAPPEQGPPPAGEEVFDGREYDEEEVAPHDGLFHHHYGSKRPHWQMTNWEDLKVGDFVKIMDNEAIPADVLLCATSEDENVAFVETKNLDGETNLKSRSAAAQLTNLRSAWSCADKRNSFRVDCDRPDTNLYRLNAAVVMPDESKTPVDIQMILLRGTVLRNTRWAIGLVLYTGEDTKIVLNSGDTPSKRSRVERQMNPQVFINLGILACMAIALGIADAILEQRYYPLNAPWLFRDNRTSDNTHINGLITAIFALITFQNIVPISLYISIEFVRTIQALWIYFDYEMYYEKTQTTTLARSWNLSDDLGQIEYIFSDKTGTLTQNAMVFRQCSIAGREYKGDPESSDDTLPVKEDPFLTKRLSGESGTASGSNSNASGSRSPTKKEGGSVDQFAVPDPHAAVEVKLSQGVLKRFKDHVLSADIAKATAVNADSTADDYSYARVLNGFWLTLALCHTVLTGQDPETGALEYKAQSPDEAALVQAAADVGFTFRGRDKDVLMVSTPFGDGIDRYELLNVLEFNSARKRMSVVVRKIDDDEKNGILLLTKGADNVIFERLRAGYQEQLKETTEEHLGDFASEGLRTLTLAWRAIPDEEYDAWSEMYHEATISLDNREEKVDAACEAIERELNLLGATAIEDKLQDGVPETIADLKEAGIKIWVATGDKLETAIAIGHSTNLIGNEDNVIIIRGGGELGRPVYSQMAGAVDEFFPSSGILNEDGIANNIQSDANPAGPYALQRVNTGVTSIVGNDNGQRPGGYVLVIDGAALNEALADDTHKQLLLRLAMQCEAVICCRVSPLQKALVVRLVKDGLGVITLAIGDGANDVSMIQAADVGVGIAGEEGLQAVNSSDYAIAQFRFLKRLLLVHGHWSYARNGNMITNFFYKNIVCIGILWWYQIYCAWSSQYDFEYTYLLFWNSFWTILPVIAMGLFDRIVDDHVLMDLPELYKHSRQGEYFNLKLFLIYMIDGIYQSVIIFFFILYAYFSPTARVDGYDTYLYEFSTTMAVGAVMIVTVFVGINITTWTSWVWWVLGIEILLIWLYTAIYSAITPASFSTPIYGNDHYLFHSAYYWLGLLFMVPLALLPRVAAKAYKFIFYPSDIDRVRYLHKIDPQHDFSKDREQGGIAYIKRSVSTSRGVKRRSIIHRGPRAAMGSRTDMATGMRSHNTGFDFSMEENGVALRRLQSNLSGMQQPEQQHKRRRSLLSSLSRTIRRKKVPSTVAEEPVMEEYPSNSPKH
ncbi:phospholipid-translocating P-type ATPase [Phanerochaete sordida]|uniref:Phospholipid-transporting ATPase n=1 Tax=Phanerochaete sordida TaxID=48140 RepID=A0A9P3GLG5_9APHY|nr:phospholipid-translocating P-type ATPase [Phanerochaete sordida]